jgi:hypothetical protein
MGRQTRLICAVAVVVGLVLFSVPAQAAPCSNTTISGNYVMTFGGVTASGSPVSALAGVVAGIEPFGILDLVVLRGSAVVNQRGSTINILQEEVHAPLFVHESCFLELTLVIEPLGSLLVVGFAHEAGRWFQFASLFDPAVQITGVAHRIE